MLKFFTPEQEERIIAAIQQAEQNTTGEIRVHLEDKCKGNIMEAAMQRFKKLHMHQTERRNGVIMFIAPERKQFAIYGDEGINKVVPVNFWDDVRDIMLSEFKKGDFTTGVCLGIERIGEKLKTYFPGIHDDINELPDDISYG